ncbi:MAG: sigma-70 family RNA polymerase sigma factor [Flavihumibacter sp.]
MAFLRSIPATDASDESLAKTYHASGDLTVLGQLYTRYMDLVFGLCMKYLDNSENARDAVMQIFEQLVIKLRQHEVTYFKSWLYTLAKNHCLMQLRSKKPFTVAALPDDLMQSEENLHLNDREQALQLMEKCIGALQEEQKQAVTLFYLREKSYHEIVAETGVEWNKVRSLIQNGRRNLKICMEKNGEDE